MTLLEAIDERISRRHYLKTPIETHKLELLDELMQKYNAVGGFRVALVVENGDAFKGFTSSYGMLTGVEHYFGFVADLNDPDADEKIGYYGEKLVLHATTLGLGTCWVGGTFNKSKVPFEIGENEKLACLITVGNIEEKQSTKEKFIYKLTHRKSKTVQNMSIVDEVAPDWFYEGVSAVTKAPSAMNKQPIILSYQNGVVCASIHARFKYLAYFDLGIAKLHFELASGGGTWVWGDGCHFTKSENI